MASLWLYVTFILHKKQIFSGTYLRTGVTMKTLWVIAIGLCSTALASPLLANSNRPWTHFGLRPLGMGNAYTAVADDFNALYYNPAGLARLDSWDGEFLNPMLIFSSKFKTLVEDAQDLKTTSDTIDLIESNTGEDQSITAGLSPHLIFRNFGFGASARLNASMIFRRDISVDVLSGLDLIVPFSYAHSFFEEKLSVGLTIKGRAVAAVDRQFSIEDLEALSDNDEGADAEAGGTTEPTQTLDDFVLAGTGVGADIGILFTPTKVMEPTIGLAVIDIGGTRFTEAKIEDDAFGKPDVQLPSVNLGLSLKPYQKNRKYIRVSMDMHAINHPYSFSKKVGIGSEFGWGQFLKTQLGFYQGYPSFGIQLDAGIVNLRVLAYSEELGEVAGSQQSQRYALQLKVLL